MIAAARKPQLRYQQVGRMFLLIDLLSPLRHGVSVADLHRDACDLSGCEWTTRTITRDLAALETLGIATQTGRPAKWRLAANRRAVTLASVAESQFDDGD